MNYGLPPEVIGQVDIDCNEFMFYMYYPISFPRTDIRLGKRLWPFMPLIREVYRMEKDSILDKYVYLTVKNQFSPKGLAHNRPGWHSDGFGTNDINYIWCNNTPTEFCIQEYDVPHDDKASLIAFEQQSKPENIVVYPDKTLLRLTPAHIHRIGVKQEDGVRLFVKISISDRKYILKGNTKNYLFDYDWSLSDRSLDRNTP